MYEARIYYKDGHMHIVEANTLEMLKNKCVHFVNSSNVYSVSVLKVEFVGYLKSNAAKELI